MDQPSRWRDADVLLYKPIMNQAICQLTYRLIHNGLTLFPLVHSAKAKRKNLFVIYWTQSFY